VSRAATTRSTERQSPSGVAQDVADSRPMNAAARFGLAARGIVYLLVGALAILVANGARAEADQKGALTVVLSKPYGGWIVGLLAVGFACYSLWRLSEAAFGVTGEPPGPGPRLRSLARAIVYAFLSVTAVLVLLGSTGSQASQQTSVTAKLMQNAGGRLLVGAVGAAVLVVGLVLAWEGVRMKFMRYFPAGELSGTTRRVVRVLGVIGTVARGLVFALAGYLVVLAAWTYDPQKAAGLDGALKTLRSWPAGPWLLTAAGIGLILFGIYGLAEARYRRV
jgi:hypothetical protein